MKRRQPEARQRKQWQQQSITNLLPDAHVLSFCLKTATQTHVTAGCDRGFRWDTKDACRHTAPSCPSQLLPACRAALHRPERNWAASCALHQASHQGSPWAQSTGIRPQACLRCMCHVCLRFCSSCDLKAEQNRANIVDMLCIVVKHACMLVESSIRLERLMPPPCMHPTTLQNLQPTALLLLSPCCVTGNMPTGNWCGRFSAPSMFCNGVSRMRCHVSTRASLPLTAPSSGLAVPRMKTQHVVVGLTSYSWWRKWSKAALGTCSSPGYSRMMKAAMRSCNQGHEKRLVLRL